MTDWARWIPVSAAAVAVLCVFGWMRAGAVTDVEARTAIADNRPPKPDTSVQEDVGRLIPGSAQPSDLEGRWVQFRGADQANIVDDAGPMADAFPEGGLREFWAVDMAEGHAGAAVINGCAYVIDYDEETKEDAIRCLNLETGEEVWRYTYPALVRAPHGKSRTIPAVTEDYCVTIGPVGHVVCLDARDGRLIWRRNLVVENGTIVPPWNMGQCPVIDGDRVVIAPGGDPLMMLIDLATGETVWETPNPGGWEMSHASVRIVQMHGVKQYVYPSMQGTASVNAETGEILWTDTAFLNRTAYVPTPVFVPPDRIFLTSGYNAGCAMLRATSLTEVETLWSLDAKTFGSDQQTPIYYDGYIYGVTAGGQMACLSVDGEVQWKSGAKNKYGLGPYIIIDGKLLVLDDMKGTLHMIEARPDAFNELDVTQVLQGHDAWAPISVAAGRMIMRDVTRMVCLEIPRPREGN